MKPATLPQEIDENGIPQYRPGDTLLNGAVLLVQDGDVVLCEWMCKEYATWRMDTEGNTHYGSYFNWQAQGGKSAAMLMASQNFHERVTKTAITSDDFMG